MFKKDNENIKFSKQFNILNKEILDIKNKNKKIILYGFGLIGKYIYSQIKENIVLIVDKSYKEREKYEDIYIDNPNNLNKYNIQYILISVLGRENEITKYLLKEKLFTEKNIISFNLELKVKRNVFLKNIFVKTLIFFEPLLTFLYLPIAVLLYLFKYKLMYNFRFTGFGHLGIEPYYVYYNPKYKNYKKIILVDSSITANNYLLNLWKQKYTVISNPYVFHLLWPLFNYKFLRINASLNRVQTIDRFFTITKNLKLEDNNDAYFNRIPTSISNVLKYKNKEVPTLFISKKDITKAKHLVLEHLGIKENDKFIILHLRDDLNYDLNRCMKNEHDYLPSLQYLHKNNIKIVKLGRNKTMSAPLTEYVINYPASSIKSEFIDIYLMSKSLFYMGASSGPLTVVPLFNTPIFVVNSPALTVCPFNEGDMYLPMLVKKDSKIVSIKDYLSNNLTWLYNDNIKKTIEDFDKYHFMQNSPDLILDGVIEMLNIHYFKKNQSNNDDDERLQERWKNSFPKLSYNAVSKAKIVNSFLKKYNKELFI